MISLNLMLFKNIAHIGSFKHFVFVYLCICVFVYLRICVFVYLAELQYTSWWDGSGMKFEMGGMDPTCRHPKPRPTNPRDFFDTSLLLYRKGMNKNHDSVNFWDSGRKSETFISYLPSPPNKSSIQSFR